MNIDLSSNQNKKQDLREDPYLAELFEISYEPWVLISSIIKPMAMTPERAEMETKGLSVFSSHVGVSLSL
jgi:hypothetical protein